MKSILLFSATLLIIASVNSQSKVVFQNAEGSDLADTMEIYYKYGIEHLTFDSYIANTDTVKGFKIRLKRVVKQSVASAKDVLCIGLFCNEQCH